MPLLKKNNPEEPDNRVRYTSYLRNKLQKLGIDKSYRIEEKSKLIHLSEIVYEYFRCFFVHEGDSRDHDIYEVQIDYTGVSFKFGGGVLMDRVNEKIKVRADWLIDILFKIAENSIPETD
ncbi:MAG: hypothetical protein P9L90_05880 [Candidatus Aadella gelida]|nr:hypothetical protein [Candidatus Aadella gelida]